MARTQPSTDVLGSTREPGLAMAWGARAAACSRGGGRGEERREGDKASPAGLALLSCVVLERSVFF